MLAQNTVTVKKEELELTRHNVTPAQFLAYVRRQIRTHKLTAILPGDIDLDYFAAGNDLNFDIRHEGDAPDDDSDDSDDGDRVPAAPAAPAAVLEPAPAVTYYHEPAEGMYHAVRHFGPGLWGVALNLDQATGDGRTYAFRPTKAQCLAVLRSLAPAAVELPGLPAWLR